MATWSTFDGDPEVEALAREIRTDTGCTMGEAFKLATLQLAELSRYSERWDAMTDRAVTVLLDYATGWDRWASGQRV
jgi:imidazoleglycerol phosphate dehydratase HisB